MIIYIKKEQTISRLGKLLLYAGMILVLIILPGCNNEKGDSSVQNDKIKPSSYAVTDDTGLTLQFTEKLTCRQILDQHPKGKDFGWIIKDFKKFLVII